MGVDRAEHNEILQFWLVRRGRKGLEWLSVYTSKRRLNTVKSNTLASRHGSAEVPLCSLSARVCRGALARLQNAPIVIGKKHAKVWLYWQSFHCLVGWLPNLALKCPCRYPSGMVQAEPLITRYHRGPWDHMVMPGDHPITRYPRVSLIIWVCKATI